MLFIISCWQGLIPCAQRAKHQLILEGRAVGKVSRENPKAEFLNSFLIDKKAKGIPEKGWHMQHWEEGR